MRMSITTLTLPAMFASNAPAVTFASTDIRLRLKLTPADDDRSWIKLFLRNGVEVYHIDDTHRDWRSALVNVGKLLADNPEIYEAA